VRDSILGCVCVIREREGEGVIEKRERE
jgi:hypothetical protein